MSKRKLEDHQNLGCPPAVSVLVFFSDHLHECWLRACAEDDREVLVGAPGSLWCSGTTDTVMPLCAAGRLRPGDAQQRMGAALLRSD